MFFFAVLFVPSMIIIEKKEQYVLSACRKPVAPAQIDFAPDTTENPLPAGKQGDVGWRHKK